MNMMMSLWVKMCTNGWSIYFSVSFFFENCLAQHYTTPTTTLSPPHTQMMFTIMRNPKENDRDKKDEIETGRRNRQSRKRRRRRRKKWRKKHHDNKYVFFNYGILIKKYFFAFLFVCIRTGPDLCDGKKRHRLF